MGFAGLCKREYPAAAWVEQLYAVFSVPSALFLGFLWVHASDGRALLLSARRRSCLLLSARGCHPPSFSTNSAVCLIASDGLCEGPEINISDGIRCASGYGRGVASTMLLLHVQHVHAGGHVCTAVCFTMQQRQDHHRSLVSVPVEAARVLLPLFVQCTVFHVWVEHLDCCLRHTMPPGAKCY
jgi:hypothetical protein